MVCVDLTERLNIWDMECKNDRHGTKLRLWDEMDGARHVNKSVVGPLILYSISQLSGRN